MSGKKGEITQNQEISEKCVGYFKNKLIELHAPHRSTGKQEISDIMSLILELFLNFKGSLIFRRVCFF